MSFFTLHQGKVDPTWKRGLMHFFPVLQRALHNQAEIQLDKTILAWCCSCGGGYTCLISTCRVNVTCIKLRSHFSIKEGNSHARWQEEVCVNRLTISLTLGLQKSRGILLEALGSG